MPPQTLSMERGTAVRRPSGVDTLVAIVPYLIALGALAYLVWATVSTLTSPGLDRRGPVRPRRDRQGLHRRFPARDPYHRVPLHRRAEGLALRAVVRPRRGDAEDDPGAHGRSRGGHSGPRVRAGAPPVRDLGRGAARPAAGHQSRLHEHGQGGLGPGGPERAPAHLRAPLLLRLAADHLGALAVGTGGGHRPSGCSTRSTSASSPSGSSSPRWRCTTASCSRCAAGTGARSRHRSSRWPPRS